LGTDPRNTLDTGPKHDFYLRQDVDFEPQEADKTRRPKDPTVRIGLESRFPNDPKRHKGTPGPHYNPSLKHEIPNPSKYSFGYRREVAGFAPLIAAVSTPKDVGPGLYLHEYQLPKTSLIPNDPKFSIGTEPRFGGFTGGWDKVQTYDMRSRSIGTQIKSQKKTLPSFSFGKSTRDAKTGTFKDMMAT